MIYVFDITTPANTAKTNKKKTVMELERGTTYRISILFPPGPSGLLHLFITDALHHVWPTNPEADFATDGETINFEDEYPILEQPYELYAYTWNLDDTYEHTLRIRIGIKSAELEEAQEILEPSALIFPRYYEL
jgi:hypothetical protein